MTITHDLISCWRQCKLESPPYLFHNDNLDKVNGHIKTRETFKEYISKAEYGLSHDTILHTGLLPVPFICDLEKASIYILMLNPGFSPSDYFAEQHSPDFRNAVIRNLRQENGNDEYPFFGLNPQFAWHPGFEYWQKKFDSIIRKIAEQPGCTYQNAMSKLAKNIACLELLPYHSKSFGAGALLKSLPSVEVMRKFVREILIPRAKDGTAIIIVTRGVNSWKLPKFVDNDYDHVIIYKGSEARAASLSKGSRGGKAICNQLNLISEKLC